MRADLTSGCTQACFTQRPEVPVIVRVLPFGYCNFKTQGHASFRSNLVVDGYASDGQASKAPISLGGGIVTFSGAGSMSRGLRWVERVGGVRGVHNHPSRLAWVLLGGQLWGWSIERVDSAAALGASWSALRLGRWAPSGGGSGRSRSEASGGCRGCRGASGGWRMRPGAPRVAPRAPGRAGVPAGVPAMQWTGELARRRPAMGACPRVKRP